MVPMLNMTRARKQLFMLTLTLIIGLLVRQLHLLNHAKQASQTAQPGLYAIDHFIDGDTIAVNMNGSVQSVRFIGVDTPETHRPNTPVQCYGPQAAAFTKQLIGKNRVRLEADSQSDSKDKYGRLVRYVYLEDGRNVDELLVQNGYGFAYLYYPFSLSSRFAADQASAQAAHRGLWGACHPYQESNSRWQTEPE